MHLEKRGRRGVQCMPHCNIRRLRLLPYPNMPLMPLGILPEDICFIIFCIWRN